MINRRSRLVLIVIVSSFIAFNVNALNSVFDDIRIKLKKGVDKSEFEIIKRKYIDETIKGEGYVVAVVNHSFSSSVYVKLYSKKRKYSTRFNVELKISKDDPDYNGNLIWKEGQRVKFHGTLTNISDTAMYFNCNIKDIKVK